MQVYLHSEARKATGDRILDTRRAKFEAALKTLHEGLSKPRCVKEYDKVQRRLGRELERHKRVSYQYKIDVLRKKDSTHAKAVTFTHLSAFEQQTQASGGYILHTSHTDWSASQVARTSSLARLCAQPIWASPSVRVKFNYQGRWISGRINRITKRATVLVDNPTGELMSDGRRYIRRYVPLSELRPAFANANRDSGSRW